MATIIRYRHIFDLNARLLVLELGGQYAHWYKVEDLEIAMSTPTNKISYNIVTDGGGIHSITSQQIREKARFEADLSTWLKIMDTTLIFKP